MEYTDKVNRKNGTVEQLKRIADSLEFLSKSIEFFLQINYSNNLQESKKRIVDIDMQTIMKKDANMRYEEDDAYGSENKSDN